MLDRPVYDFKISVVQWTVIITSFSEEDLLFESFSPKITAIVAALSVEYDLTGCQVPVITVTGTDRFGLLV
jgi:hypothetical protein